jgi:hypothetical protein
MPAAMCISVPVISSHARAAHRVVSVPYVRDLIDDASGKYFLAPDDKPAPRPPGGARLRGRPRGPSVTTMLRDWSESGGSRQTFRVKLERRLHRSGLLRSRRPSREESTRIDRMLADPDATVA